MYLQTIPPVAYKDPWNRPLEDRLKALERGHKRVAYIYLLPDYYIFRYRVYNMIQALERSASGVSAAWFTERSLPVLNRVVDAADVIVICRTKYDQELGRLIARARAKGKVVFFDVDDLVFDLHYIHLILNNHDLDRNDPVTWDNWFAHIGRLRATMDLCDRAITTNGYLAAYVQPHFGEKVAVIPNFLNREQMEISRRIYFAKKSAAFARTEQIHLGYFSGTASHNKDFEVAAGAIAGIMRKHPQVVLRLVGPLEVDGRLKEFSSRIERFPLQDFVNLQRLIGQVEINLIPLQDNEFTNCKSELKYFESAVVGAISVATPAYSLAQAITAGKTGLLAKSYEWGEGIQQAIDLVQKPEGIEMAETAMLQAVTNYAWYEQVDRIESTLFSSPENGRSPDPGIPQPVPIFIPSASAEEPAPGGNGISTPVETTRPLDIRREELIDRDAVLASLKAELEEIHRSQSWKTILRLRTFKARLVSPVGFPALVQKFIQGMVREPGVAWKKTTGKVRQIVANPQRRVKQVQDGLIRQNFDPNTSRLIVFLVPGGDAINGGTMSICSLAKVSAALKPVHQAEVMIATLPKVIVFNKYTLFDNPFDIYRFEQLYTYFTGLKELTLHLPEAFVRHFVVALSNTERDFLLKIPTLRINILNQNIWLMPPRAIINELKRYTDLVTCTTAHSVYCTKEYQDRYGIPFHHFSASNLTEYHYSPYPDKENIMIVSHDRHDYKDRILSSIQAEHPDLTIQKIENMRYEDYKRLLSRAKWAITFGEGIDGYFVESIRCGAIPFAVYNPEFFGERFHYLPNVYQSYEDMLKGLARDMKALDTPAAFQPLSKKLIDLDAKEYNDEEYKDNVRRFYLGEYDLP